MNDFQQLMVFYHTFSASYTINNNFIKYLNSMLDADVHRKNNFISFKIQQQSNANISSQSTLAD